MSHGNRQFALTYDQRLLLDMYINFYNHTTRQMDSLYDLQSEIIEHINEISGLSSRERTRFTYNETPYYTRFNTNHHQNQNQNQPRNNNQNTSNNRRNNQNRNERVRQAAQTQVSPSNSRVVYIEGVPYLLDLTNFMRIRNSNNGNTDAANLWRTFNDNITVAPTRTQVENSTRLVQFTEITNPINSSCPITLERFDENSNVTQILHCGHIFTPSGIESWFQTNVRCPVCRYDIRDYRTPIVTTPPSPPINREERHRVTEPANDDESKEEETIEVAEETIAAADNPLPSTRSSNERISNSNRQNTNQNNRRITSENVTNVLSNITEEILNNILQPNGGTRTLFDPSQNSLFYDSSNNQFIFESFIRR